jgi:effector-binding domain-containing protein
MKIPKQWLISVVIGTGIFITTIVAMFYWFGSIGATMAYLNGQSVYVYPKKIDLDNQKPGTETVAVFYMKNLTSKKISVIGEKSSCACAFSEKIPITVPARQTVELRIKIHLPKYENDYNQIISFMVAEPKYLVMHPVQVTAKTPNPLEKPTPVESKKSNKPQTEDNKS